MRAVIVCGAREARNVDWFDAVYGMIGSSPLVVVHGACGVDADAPDWRTIKGIDRIAHEIATVDLGMSVLPMPARWERYGPSAGPIRNQKMLDLLRALGGCGYEIAVLAFHDDLANGSKGTKNMVDKARFAHVPYAVYDRDGREVTYP